ncbi:hypothetical protein BH11BAC7_BH11BAC7_33250 [soil metagenome]
MSFRDFIDITSSAGTLILSLLALLFSFYAYRRVSLKGEYKKKQLETVFKLTEVLQDTIISFSEEGLRDPIGKRSSSGTMFRFFRMPPLNHFEGFIDTEVLLVRESPDRSYKFIEFSEHPYIPTEIALHIKQFIAYVEGEEPIDLKSIKSMTVLGGLGLIDPCREYYQITDNPVYKDLQSFCKKCKELDIAIHKWLKSVGITDLNKKELIE